MDQKLELRVPKIVNSVHLVEHEPTWRVEIFALNFIVLEREPCGTELESVYRWALKEKLQNPRVISPQVLSWSSLFQPRFFKAMQRSLGPAVLPTVSLVSRNADSTGPLEIDKLLFWLQSVVFLSAVTISAAIVQGRWSEGTLASKLDKLWLAGEIGQQNETFEFANLSLLEGVKNISSATNLTRLQQQLEIRRLFFSLVRRIGKGANCNRIRMRALSGGDLRLARFGFVNDLRIQINDLRAVIVYGSSVTSDNFADYDVILIVDSPELTLSKLERTSPVWAGKELNVSVYSQDEFWDMQKLSGDNLADYGICVFGEVDVPEKPLEVLLIRNMSFGMVRLRQQLGMIGDAVAFAPKGGDDKINLFHYFVKIPSNIAKGTFGAVGQRRSKDDVNDWLIKNVSFNTVQEQADVIAIGPSKPLANSAVATSKTLQLLNCDLNVVEPKTGTRET